MVSSHSRFFFFCVFLFFAEASSSRTWRTASTSTSLMSATVRRLLPETLPLPPAAVDRKREIKRGVCEQKIKATHVFSLQTSSPPPAGKTRRWTRRTVSGLPLQTFPQRFDTRLEAPFPKASEAPPPPGSADSALTRAGLVGGRF